MSPCGGVRQEGLSGLAGAQPLVRAGLQLVGEATPLGRAVCFPNSSVPLLENALPDTPRMGLTLLPDTLCPGQVDRRGFLLGVPCVCVHLQYRTALRRAFPTSPCLLALIQSLLFPWNSARVENSKIWMCPMSVNHSLWHIRSWDFGIFSHIIFEANFASKAVIGKDFLMISCKIFWDFPF